MADYMATLKEVFDFPMLRKFVTRSDFSMVFDALHAVTGAYAGPIFVDELGAEPSSIRCRTITIRVECHSSTCNDMTSMLVAAMILLVIREGGQSCR